MSARPPRLVAGVALSALVLSLTPATAHAVPSGVTAELIGSELRITGTSTADAITVRLSPTNPQLLDVLTGLSRSPEFSFRRPLVGAIRVEAGGGDDAVALSDSNGIFTDAVASSVFGGDGTDRLTGGAGNETLLGGSGADTLDGQGGEDQLLGGAGDDIAVWSPSHGDDVLEGQTGSDRVLLDTTSGDDHLEIVASSGRLQTFVVGTGSRLDAAGLELLVARPGRGKDTVVVSDLATVGHPTVDLDLDVAGGAPSDGEPDTLEVAATASADTVTVTKADERAVVTSPGSTVRISGADRFADRLLVDADLGDDTLDVQPGVGDVLATRVDGSGGHDTVVTEGTAAGDSISLSPVEGRVQLNQLGDVYDATAEEFLVRGQDGPDDLRVLGDLDPITHVTLDGGPGDDRLDGGAGDERLVGGDGRDQVVGHAGDDTLLMGAGNDSSFWSPGDGSDVVEGGGDIHDVLFVRGSDRADTLAASRVGARVSVQAGSDTLDVDDVERVSLDPRGGRDQVTVHDLSGTDVHSASSYLAIMGSGGNNPDGAADAITFAGTPGNDALSVAGNAEFLVVHGLSWAPRLQHIDATLDVLTLDTLAGVDSVTATELAPGSITLEII